MTRELPNSSSVIVQEDEFQRTKAPRIRSAAYPSYTIEFCTEFTKKFHQQFGNSTYNQREEISKVLKISVGQIMTQLSSSVQYGLIDIKIKVGYKPAESFLRIYKPIDENERREALIDCLLNPELYRKLLFQFKGGTVPSIHALSTILFRNHNIAEAASESAAQVFIDNLNYLQLLDADNNLLLDREIELDEQEQKPKAQKEQTGSVIKKPAPVYIPEVRTKVETKPVEIAVYEQPQSYPIPIPLKGGRLAKLIIPEGFSNEDLDKISKFIEALRE